MSIIINNNIFPENTIFKIAIEPEFFNLENVTLKTKSRHIRMLPISNIQIGMTLINNGKEEIIKEIYSDIKNNEESFYFMHLNKTSGISLNNELYHFFHNKIIYSNNIGLIDNSQILGSSLITGHFGNYPIHLFKDKSKMLNSFTILRNPIDRVISHFLYYLDVGNIMSENNSVKRLTIEELESFIYLCPNASSNHQTKYITSPIDSSVSNKSANSFLNKEKSLYDCISDSKNSVQFMSNSNKEAFWKNGIDNFFLIGTMENRENFTIKLFDFLNKKGYTGNPKKYFSNIGKKNNHITEFIKSVPDSILNKIVEINNHDIEMYEYVKSIEKKSL